MSTDMFKSVNRRDATGKAVLGKNGKPVSDLIEMTAEEAAAFEAERAAETSDDWMCSAVQFINRFTGAEQEAIFTSANAKVRLWFFKIGASQAIRFGDEWVKTGIELLVNENILTRERANEVLGIRST